MFNKVRTAKVQLAGALMCLPALAFGQEDAPLSAIDWLTQTPTVTVNINPEPPVTDAGDTPQIDVSELGQSGRDAVGLLPSHVTGLPSSIWQDSKALTLADLISDIPEEPLPAIQALMYTLLLAEANPPADAGGNDALLLARVDKLVALGAIEQANALLDRAAPDRADLFTRWFDVSLLIGEEQRACDVLSGAPHLAPSYAARVFCQARDGAWETAVITLNTANFLKLISPADDALLVRFLDPELFAEEPLLITVSEPDPLQFRLFEAIGEPQPTRLLPRAYAHADLRDNIGWKAQLEAAERLAKVGALTENRLFGLYLDRKPAASGTIWDRVAAVQKFQSALTAGDAVKIAESLPLAWSAMKAAHLEVPFARYYGDTLKSLPKGSVAGTLGREIRLLSESYELAARDGTRDFLAGLAMGQPPKRSADPTRQAIADAFHRAGVPQVWTNRLARGQLGEVILLAIKSFQQGASGDLRALTNALATFRAVGLEDTARQASLQVLLLERGF
ncbi:hypothetical protein [Cognatishimia activa]|uniref:Uncharacterized protein n=1 Tax=Cognatishimia activa TaxID=1715691 RepID=A0A0P1IP53_9RHOB|nr:hypothetical protein [Cognatishimia activa]CUJ23099.1 hypothetical protein TA5113_02729 [Cognatishimia activa]CUK25405.1 hypothetical protein TA5114_01203 [Cognatishimia activa]